MVVVQRRSVSSRFAGFIKDDAGDFCWIRCFKILDCSLFDAFELGTGSNEMEIVGAAVAAYYLF